MEHSQWYNTILTISLNLSSCGKLRHQHIPSQSWILYYKIMKTMLIQFMYWFARVLHRILAWKSLTYWHFEGSGGAEFRFTKPMWVQRDPGPACWYELGSSFRSPRTSRFFTGCQRGWTYWGRGWWLGICWCLLWAHHWKFEGDKMMKLLKHDWNMINSDKTNELLACLDPFYTELSWYPGRCPVQSC